MTQTPASRPCGLETTPPISFAPIGTAAASLCDCARGETNIPTNNTAAASTGSLSPIFMDSSLSAPAAPPLPILPKPRTESTDQTPSGPRAAGVPPSIVTALGFD